MPLRKNSIDIKELVAFDWNLDNVAAVAAFSREAFIMAGVQTEELRQALFEEAKKVFASGGSYLDWANTFEMHGFEPENPYHLRTNYDTAANAAYAAGQWQQIEEYKLYFPYLRYVTMRDEKVRDEHWAMDGLIYPVDDPFWDSYTPPNGWNCRCSVEQLLESELPDDYQPMEPDTPVKVDPMFKNNPGKSKIMYNFDPGQPVKTWKEAGLPPWSHYPSTEADLIDTGKMDLAALLVLYTETLGNRKILDINRIPVVLAEIKAEKFIEGYSLENIRGRFKYLKCIQDTIRTPYEVWLNPLTKRVYYLKKYDKNVVLIAELEHNGQLMYFNIMIGADTVPNKVRQGTLEYYLAT